MSEKYELSTPYQPLGPPSRAYQEGWERVFGKAAKRRAKMKVQKGWGCATTPRQNLGGPAAVATPPLGPDPGERPGKDQ